MTTTAINLGRDLAETAERLEAADSPEELLAAIAAAFDLTAALNDKRLAALRELRRAGMTNNELAELAGLTRSRISQLLGPLDDLERRRIRNTVQSTNTTGK